MYRNTKFVEVLHKIRNQMSEEFDNDLIKMVQALQVRNEPENRIEKLSVAGETDESAELLNIRYGNRV